MIRLFVVCEGQTEEHFVKALLGPHLRQFNVYATPTVVCTRPARGADPSKRGGGSWKHWKTDIRNLLGSQAADLRVTMLADLYGLSSDFPGHAEHQQVADTEERCHLLESALAKELDDRRFIPYLQRHEFEALVLASLPALRRRLTSDEDRNGHDELVQDLSGRAPEEVNDDPQTAPSKRLKTHIPSYNKTVDGPGALRDTGLDHLRSECPRFEVWLATLEALEDPPREA